MECKCPSCQSSLIKKNGHIHNGKQNYRCITCSRQFVLDPIHKIVDEKTKSQVRRALLERVSLHGVCRICEVSMSWLLEFIDDLIAELPKDLNAEVVQEDDEIEVVVLQADELWSYVGSKQNPQWLWLVMHTKTRQVIAMQIGQRDKQTTEKLFFKLPDTLKKKPFLILTSSLCTTRQYPQSNTGLLAKNPVKHRTLRDLIAPLDNDVQGL